MIPLQGLKDNDEYSQISTNQLNISQFFKQPFAFSSLFSENIIEDLFEKFSKGFRIIGPFFAFALTIFVFIVTHAFFQIILPYWVQKTHIVVGLIMIIIAFFLLFSVLFNYFLAVLVKPGSVEDIKKSKFYKKNDPLRVSANRINFNVVLDNKNNEILETKYEEKLEVKSSKDSINVSPSNPITEIHPQLPECRFCRQPKPLRTHHCTVCGYCVFKMDHHCPWINNCVGQNNQRYFLLFLTHLLIGCVYVVLTAIPIWLNTTIIKSPEFNFISILSTAGIILASFFNIWHWFLVLRGTTTIEFWALKGGMQSNLPIKDFSMKKWRDNLFLVFGTRSLLQAIFVPSITRLPYSGLEWTKLVYESYNFEIIELEEIQPKIHLV